MINYIGTLAHVLRTRRQDVLHSSVMLRRCTSLEWNAEKPFCPPPTIWVAERLQLAGKADNAAVCSSDLSMLVSVRLSRSILSCRRVLCLVQIAFIMRAWEMLVIMHVLLHLVPDSLQQENKAVNSHLYGAAVSQQL